MTQSQETTKAVKVNRFVCPHCSAANEIAETTDGYSVWNSIAWGGVRGGGIGLLTFFNPIVGATALTIVAAQAVAGCLSSTKITCGQCEQEFVQKTEVNKCEE